MPRSCPCWPGALLLAFVLFPAGATQDLFWEHKQWRTYAEADANGVRHCVAMTGGDGDNMLELHATAGVGVSIRFEEQTYRGLEPFLKATDVLSFRLDGSPAVLGGHLQPSLGYDADGIPTASVSVPAGAAASLIAAMRNATTLTVLHSRGAGDAPDAIGEFSLAGFTANYLKAVEWCGITPDAQAAR